MVKFPDPAKRSGSATLVPTWNDTYLQAFYLVPHAKEGLIIWGRNTVICLFYKLPEEFIMQCCSVYWHRSRLIYLADGLITKHHNMYVCSIRALESSICSFSSLLLQQ
jgi:hypothetical protein